MVALLLCLLALLLPGPGAAAGSERYEYDGLGRLVRVIDAGNSVTEYQYDAAGNITAVIAGGAAVAPTVTAVQPTAVRRASTVRMSLTGTQLANASLSAADPEITISRVTRAATTMAFDLSVSAAAALGASSLRVSTAAGTASASITVRPALPVAQVAPLPIAVAPGGSAAAYDLTLDHADDEAHSFALSMVRPELATVTPTTLSIPAGQTVARFSVRGLVGGNTELRAVSATLGSLQLPVFITANPEGVNNARAHPVGVELAVTQPPAVERPLLALSPLVGLSFGDSVWIDTQPRYVAQGSSQTLRIIGQGLPADLTVQIEPAAGLTLGGPQLSADGSQASVTISAAASAAPGLRSLVVSAGGRRLLPATAGADDFDVVTPGPELTSVAPILVEPGATIAAFEIRGRHLQDVTAVEFRGGGVTAGSSLTVNADGSLLILGLQVSPVAQPGQRLVIVHAPGGSSSATASPANSFAVSDGASGFQPYKDLQSPQVGVELAGGPGGETERPVLQLSPAVGLSVGPVLTGMSPPSLARGESRQLVLNGEHLQSVDSVVFEPATGLSVGSPSPAPDGRSVTLTLSAETSAPLGQRRVLVSSAGQAIAFAQALRPSLLITPVLPVLESIEPATVRAGTSFSLQLRGRNFQNASAVRITPAAGISIGPVSVNPEGSLAEVAVSITAAAARGPRIVSLVAPAGETLTAASPANTLLIGDAPVTYANLMAAAVGLQLGDGGGPGAPGLEASFLAPLVGVQVGEIAVGGTPGSALALPVGVELTRPSDPVSTELFAHSLPIGVLRGPGVVSVQPAGLLRGQTAELTVQGHALPAGASVQLLPAGQIVPQGNAAVEPDGRALRQTVSVAAAAPLQLYELQVLDPAGAIVPPAFVGPSFVQVLERLPEVVSLEPILARQGDSLVLIVRGVGLHWASQVLAEPPGGLEISSSFSVNAAGTELSVPVQVRADAPAGPRVIRVFNPAGGSSAMASPANTFTVYPKE
ncbi:RHS repeat protein [Paucibacter sp. O1-1]|nr:RHS repeat protein [Paucibacter sp. O1-1]MDA3825590.1 RHS repeat protein [Paucibacter sp. O1-1]